MYTSGSTGRPNGAMVAHRQILNWLHAMWERLPFGPGEMVAQKTVAAFSISVKELLAGLLSGTPQVFIADEAVKDTRAFARAAPLEGDTAQHRALASASAPASREVSPRPGFAQALPRPPGEALTQTLRTEVKMKLPWVQVWNIYGCTELNDTTYCHPDEQEGVAPRCTDWPAHRQHQGLCPGRKPASRPAGRGRRTLRGVGRGPGYCGQPALTAERFIANPFSERPGARLYRTRRPRALSGKRCGARISGAHRF